MIYEDMKSIIQSFPAKAVQIEKAKSFRFQFLVASIQLLTFLNPCL